MIGLASKRQRIRKLNRKTHAPVNPEELHPNMRAGLTEGMSLPEVAEYLGPAQNQSGTEAISHLRDEGSVEGTRVPTPRFVAQDSLAAVWHDEPTGRLQRDVKIQMMPETMEAMRAGMICLRCLEPQEEAFPFECDLCGYSMQARQSLDLRMEFEGDVHLGPAKPISTYLEEQEERVEQQRRRQARLNGGRSIQVTKTIMSPGAKRARFGDSAPTKGSVRPLDAEKKIVLPKGVQV